jgi:ankyrin repeat protein
MNSFHQAVGSGDVETVRTQLNRNPALVSRRDDGGETPLHLAAIKGHEAVVELLLSSRANPNSRNRAGDTPLHWAAFNGHEGVAELLLSCGAEVDAKNNNGATPAQEAGKRGHRDLQKLLRAGGKMFADGPYMLQQKSASAFVASLKASLPPRFEVRLKTRAKSPIVQVRDGLWRGASLVLSNANGQVALTGILYGIPSFPAWAIVIVGTWAALSIIITIAFSAILLLPLIVAQGKFQVWLFFVPSALLTALVSGGVENWIAKRLRRSSWPVELKKAIENAKLPQAQESSAGTALLGSQSRSNDVANQKAKVLDEAFTIYQERALSSATIASPPAGTTIQLGATSLCGGREWVEVTLPNGDRGYSLGPTVRGHTSTFRIN